MNPTPPSALPAPLAAPTPRRPRRDATFWRPVLNRLSESGLAIAAFCEQEGLPASSIYHWRRKLEADSSDCDSAPRVVRLDLPAAVVMPAADVAHADSVVAELPNGTRLTADARHLATLVGALASC